MQFQQHLDADVSKWTLDPLQQYGFMILKYVFEEVEVRTIAEQLEVALRNFNEQSILRSRGQTYGSRNLLEVLPTIANYVIDSPLNRFATVVLGSLSRPAMPLRITPNSLSATDRYPAIICGLLQSTPTISRHAFRTSASVAATLFLTPANRVAAPPNAKRGTARTSATR